MLSLGKLVYFFQNSTFGYNDGRVLSAIRIGTPQNQGLINVRNDNDRDAADRNNPLIINRAILFTVNTLLNLQQFRLTFTNVKINSGGTNGNGPFRIVVTVNPSTSNNSGDTNESPTVHLGSSITGTGSSNDDTPLRGWVLDIADAGRGVSGALNMRFQGNNLWEQDHRFFLSRTPASTSPFITNGAGNAQATSAITNILVQATKGSANDDYTATLCDFADGGWMQLTGI